LAVLVIAAALGAIHAIQPGHGKSLVSAIALGPDTPIYQPVLLGLVTTLAHTSSVLLIAVILWLTGATQVAGLHRGLTQAAGFAIAAGGFWRLGRHLGSKPEHEDLDVSRLVPGGESLAGLLGLGIAGGLVPCWEAVGLVILSAALGRLGTGIIVVLAFGLGMAAVLVGIGLLVAQLKLLALADARTRAWESQLGLLSGAVLAIIGLTFFLR
jgi:ABC-type nickel/cobalt efflux system permease component RcnA